MRGQALYGPAEETMPAILHDDRQGVSPVIAVILLIAITVILAAVLYMMVSGLFSPSGSRADYVGVSASLSPDGKDWILTVVSVTPGLSQNQTSLLLRASNGSTIFPATTFFQLERPVQGVEYVPAAYGPSNLAANDRVLVSTARFPSGTEYVIIGVDTVLASGTV